MLLTSTLGVFCEVAGLGVSTFSSVNRSIAGELAITSWALVKRLGRLLGIFLGSGGVGTSSSARGLNLRSANRPRKVFGLGFTFLGITRLGHERRQVFLVF